MAESLFVPITIGAAVGAGLSLAASPEQKQSGRGQKALVSGAVITTIAMLSLSRHKLGGGAFAALGLYAMYKANQAEKSEMVRAKMAAGAMGLILGGGMIVGGEAIAHGIARFAVGSGATSIVAGTLDILEAKAAKP